MSRSIAVKHLWVEVKWENTDFKGFCCLAPLSHVEQCGDILYAHQRSWVITNKIVCTMMRETMLNDRRTCTLIEMSGYVGSGFKLDSFVVNFQWFSRLCYWHSDSALVTITKSLAIIGEASSPSTPLCIFGAAFAPHHHRPASKHPLSPNWPLILLMYALSETFLVYYK